MSDNDLIRRGDALAAVRTSDFRWEAEDAIAAMPAVTVGVKPLGANGVKIHPQDILNAAWRDDLGEEGLAMYDRILAALEPVAAPRRYMGQIMAECDCSRQSECEAAQRCLAAPDRAHHVNEPPKSEHDAGNVLTPDPAAIREAALREAADVCTYVIKNIDILKADGETYETPRVQKIARGLVDVARQDILALIQKGAADDRA